MTVLKTMRKRRSYYRGRTRHVRQMESRFVRASGLRRLLARRGRPQGAPLLWTVIALLAVLGIGGGAPTSLQSRARIIDTVSGLAGFDFVAWEIQAIRQKIGAALRRPAAGLAVEAQIELTRAYLERAQHIGQVERELNQMISSGSRHAVCAHPQLSRPDAQAATEANEPAMSGGWRADSCALATATAALRRELAELRQQQAADRSQVEAILQRQIQEELVDAGLGVRGVVFPPVQFTFTEPPQKLTVSPRDRIATIYTRMLQADNDPVAIDEGEQAIEASTNLSAYISNVGGVGVYPAMVVDRASLQWTLSTIAHEWTHNYLTLFPLGLRYGINGELTILNETVADIVGDEIGARLARRYYPEALPRSASDSAALRKGPGRVQRPPPFDFRREMRETRLHVDALLAGGLVETAEAYMEARRRYFVAQGYPIRVLNQAYFAFHGSYATGAAASSPIGPQLLRLREESDDLAHFLERVRWFTGRADLERALEDV